MENIQMLTTFWAIKWDSHKCQRTEITEYVLSPQYKLGSKSTIQVRLKTSGEKKKKKPRKISTYLKFKNILLNRPQVKEGIPMESRKYFYLDGNKNVK